jgi:quercetin dioxygenase-like cupin family protein
MMSNALTVIRHAERSIMPLAGGATYQPIIGDDTGAGLPIRTGIQVSPPGYSTPLHSHPYPEILTVIEGRGEAWIVDAQGVVALDPGVTIVLPSNRPHGFRVVGERPLVTFGIHNSGKRIVNCESPPAGDG